MPGAPSSARPRAGHRRVATLAALPVVVLAVALPATVLAGRSWTIEASPHQLTLDASTAVRLTVTNTSSSGSGLACVEVDLPADFEVSSVAVVSVNGQSGGGLLGWTATWLGGSTVAFRSTLGQGALDEGDVAVFRITGTATQAGPMSWTVVGSDDAGLLTATCGSEDYSGTVQLDVLGATPAPTPTPTVTPTRTPTPTAAPTPAPTPTRPPVIVVPSLAIPTLPPLLSTPGPGGTPDPTVRTTPGPASTFAPTANPSRNPDDGSPPPPSDDGAGDVGGGLVMPGRRPADGAGPEAGFDDAVFDTLNGLPGGVLAWAYPAFVISVPGLLLLLAVAAQAIGAFAWLPLIRRRLGEFGPRRARGE